MGFLPWDLCLSGGLGHEGGRAALLPGADGGLGLLLRRLGWRGGMDGDGDVGTRQGWWRGAGLVGGRGDLAVREERAGGEGADLDAVGRGLAHLLAAVVFAIAAAAGGEFLLLTGKQQGRDQRKAEGDQQQDDGRNTPHASIVQGLARM